MKKIQIVSEVSGPLHTVKLENFSYFEEKMTKIKYLKILKQDMDKSFLEAAIGQLAFKGKKITAKRVQKICKKTLTKMIEETDQ